MKQRIWCRRQRLLKISPELPARFRQQDEEPLLEPLCHLCSEVPCQATGLRRAAREAVRDSARTYQQPVTRLARVLATGPDPFPRAR